MNVFSVTAEFSYDFPWRNNMSSASIEKINKLMFVSLSTFKMFRIKNHIWHKKVYRMRKVMQQKRIIWKDQKREKNEDASATYQIVLAPFWLCFSMCKWLSNYPWALKHCHWLPMTWRTDLKFKYYRSNDHSWWLDPISYHKPVLFQVIEHRSSLKLA